MATRTDSGSSTWAVSHESPTLVPMATEELAPVDSYLVTAKAKIIGVTDQGLILDRTPFYVRGGGQPGDTGVLRTDSSTITVTDTFRTKGVPIHSFEGPPPTEGTLVEAEIDWARRYTLMRTHTAVHALTAVIWYGFGAKATGSGMKPGEGRVDFELDSMTVDFGRMVEQRLNEELARHRETSILYMDRETALADPDLIRTKVNLIPEFVTTIRVVDIDGLDRQADGGTHVRNTSEVGSISVIKAESKGKGFKRLRIALTDGAQSPV